MSAANVLAPYRVLDLTDINGWSCGRILGDLGADVIKIEPPHGDPGRIHALHWLAYNANKRGITLNLATVPGRDIFQRLVQQADFVVTSGSRGTPELHELDYPALSKINPRVILTTITPFGTTGAYANYRGSDLTATAASGFMSLVGEPDREPLRVTLPQSPMWAGMYAAAGTLIALYHRTRTGSGQQVDTSMQASMLWALATAPTYWSLNRENLTRGGNFVVGRSITGARMRALYPCRDGHINFIIYGGEAGRRSNEAMIEWMAESGRAPEHLKQKDWSAFNVATSTQAEIDSIEEPFMAFLSDKTKAEFSAESVKRGIMGYPVANARDIRDDSQLVARDFWQRVENDGSMVTFPGAFAKFSTTEVCIRRRAPQVGEHNYDIFVSELGLGQNELMELKDEQVI